jgi:hypothetical protein
MQALSQAYVEMRSVGMSRKVRQGWNFCLYWHEMLADLSS